MPDNPRLAELLSGGYAPQRQPGLADLLMNENLLPAQPSPRTPTVQAHMGSPNLMVNQTMPDHGMSAGERFMAGPSMGDVLGLAGGPSMAMAMGPGRSLYASLLRDAGTDQSVFNTVLGSLKSDKLSKAELSSLANEYANSVTKHKTMGEALDEIQRAFLRRSRFENKIAP